MPGYLIFDYVVRTGLFLLFALFCFGGALVVWDCRPKQRPWGPVRRDWPNTVMGVICVLLMGGVAVMVVVDGKTRRRCIAEGILVHCPTCNTEVDIKSIKK